MLKTREWKWRENRKSAASAEQQNIRNQRYIRTESITTDNKMKKRGSVTMTIETSTNTCA